MNEKIAFGGANRGPSDLNYLSAIAHIVRVFFFPAEPSSFPAGHRFAENCSA